MSNASTLPFNASPGTVSFINFISEPGCLGHLKIHWMPGYMYYHTPCKRARLHGVDLTLDKLRQWGLHAYTNVLPLYTSSQA